VYYGLHKLEKQIEYGYKKVNDERKKLQEKIEHHLQKINDNGHMGIVAQRLTHQPPYRTPTLSTAGVKTNDWGGFERPGPKIWRSG